MENKDEIAEGERVTLEDCPIGLFINAYGGLCLKTEYGNNEGRIDAYIVSSGEFFWGDNPQTIANQRKQLVTPVDEDALRASAEQAKDLELKLSESEARVRVLTGERDAASEVEAARQRRELAHAIIMASNCRDETVAVDDSLLVLAHPDGAVTVNLRKLETSVGAALRAVTKQASRVLTGARNDIGCPFCGCDPFHYEDNGLGMERVAVNCCDHGVELYRSKDECDPIHDIAAICRTMRARISKLEDEQDASAEQVRVLTGERDAFAADAAHCFNRAVAEADHG